MMFAHHGWTMWSRVSMSGLFFPKYYNFRNVSGFIKQLMKKMYGDGESLSIYFKTWTQSNSFSGLCRNHEFICHALHIEAGAQASVCVSHLKVPLPSSSLISKLTVKVNKSLSGVRGAACWDNSMAFFADRRNAVAKLYSILLTCRGNTHTHTETQLQFLKK